MRKLIASSLAAGLLVGIPGISLADEPAAESAARATPEVTDESSPDVVGPVLPSAPEAGAPAPSAPGSTAAGPQLPASDMAADVDAPDQLVGATVYGSDDEELGTVVAVLADGAKSPEATVEFGGFLGLGTKEVAVPISLFSHGDDGRLVVDLTEDELDKLYETAQRKPEREDQS